MTKQTNKRPSLNRVENKDQHPMLSLDLHMHAKLLALQRDLLCWFTSPGYNLLTSLYESVEIPHINACACVHTITRSFVCPWQPYYLHFASLPLWWGGDKEFSIGRQKPKSSSPPLTLSTQNIPHKVIQMNSTAKQKTPGNNCPKAVVEVVNLI